jgi:AbrB family looped-hinge helix DNA binding protein
LFFRRESISITGMSNTYRITSKGQVTIPQEIREKLHLLPHTEVRFEIENGVAVLHKVTPNKLQGKSRGASLISKLRGKATVKMTTDEIVALTRK